MKLDEAAAETLPFDEASLDLVVSSFLLHELPKEIRAKAIAEMARVVKPGGLVVIVDSLQKGDRPDWDGLLDLFPHYFHEPYYAEYTAGSLEGRFRAGLQPVSTRTRLPVEDRRLHEVATARPSRRAGGGSRS